MTLTKASLSSRLADLEGKISGLSEQYSIASIGKELETLQGKIKDAEKRGYAYLASLKAGLPDLLRKVGDLRDELGATLNEHQDGMKKDFSEAQYIVERIKDDNEAILSRAEKEVGDVETKFAAAESALRELVAPVTDAISAATSELYKIDRYLDAKEEASFDFASGENVILADKAEWVATGRGKDDPDGIVYLTNQRVLFEQKEKTGKKLGMFGGKKEQELEWAVTLDQIENIEIENKGMLGGKDMITLTLAAGSDYHQLVMEIKSADNKFWQEMLQKAKSGQVE